MNHTKRCNSSRSLLRRHTAEHGVMRSVGRPHTSHSNSIIGGGRCSGAAASSTTASATAASGTCDGDLLLLLRCLCLLFLGGI